LIFNLLLKKIVSHRFSQVSIQLSTAKPSVGGSPPKFPMKKVHFKTLSYDYGGMADEAFSSGNNPMYHVNNMMQVQSASFSKAPERERSRTSSAAPLMPSMTALTAESTTGTSATTFTIPRSATVLSDNKPHKVSFMFFYQYFVIFFCL
jgi:hypothetical protein